METLLEDDHPRTIWIKFRFIQFSGSEEDLQLFNHSSYGGQGHRTQFWKRTIPGLPHPSMVQFGLVILKKIIKYKNHRKPYTHAKTLI